MATLRISASTENPMEALRVRGWATRRSNKIKGLIESAPPLTQEQIDDLIDLLQDHEVLAPSNRR